MKYITGILLIITLASCINDEEGVENQLKKKSYSSLNQHHQNTQEFKVYSDSDTTLIGEQGTKMFIKRNIFNTKSEVVTLKINEFYDIPSMILSNLRTVSGDSIIETDGMIKIKATDEFGEVALKTNKSIELHMPKVKSDMHLFYGNKEGNNWEIQENTVFIDYDEGQDSVVEQVLTQYKKSNIFNITSLGWINADKFIEYEKKINLIVHLPENQKGGVYSLVFHNYNSILPGFPNEKGMIVFKGIPNGEKVTILGIGSKEETLYYNSIDLTTDAKSAKIPELEEITKENLQMELQTKFGSSLADRK